MNILAIETATPACAVGVRDRRRARVDPGRRRRTSPHRGARPGVLRLCSTSVELRPARRRPGRRRPRAGALHRTARRYRHGDRASPRRSGCELVGVTSLEMLAPAARSTRGCAARSSACVDGRRGEVFVQTFELDRRCHARWTDLASPRPATSSRLARQVRRRSRSPVTASRATGAAFEALRPADDLRPGRAVGARRALALGADASAERGRGAALPARSRRRRQLHDPRTSA